MSQKTVTAYHYTDEAGALGILESGTISASGDGRHGGGVYTTTAPPSSGAGRIDHNCYDGAERG
eukprot:COSAG01_NODE_59927_length_297_cov_1.045455_1_plen_63_part_10